MDICWLNPLSQDHLDVVSLSAATVAPPDVVADLLGAHRIGEAYQAFKQERLEANPATTKFHDKMTKKKLKTFSDIRKKTHNLGQAQQAVLKADRNLFGHMILVAESRQLRMSDVLVHPLGPLPWALANEQGYRKRHSVQEHSARSQHPTMEKSALQFLQQSKTYQILGR